MSEKTKEVKKFQDTMYTLNLHGETIYKYSDGEFYSGAELTS